MSALKAMQPLKGRSRSDEPFNEESRAFKVSNDDEEEDEDNWDDVEPDEDEQPQILCLFEDFSFPNVCSMLDHCRKVHNLDLAEACRSMGGYVINLSMSTELLSH